VPGVVREVHVESLMSTSVTLSWSPIDCCQCNGRSVGYVCELVHDHQTSHDVQTSHEDRQIVRREVVNGTQLQLSQLQPFTHYVFAVLFRNSDFDGPATSINFTTAGGGLLFRLHHVGLVVTQLRPKILIGLDCFIAIQDRDQMGLHYGL